MCSNRHLWCSRSLHACKCYMHAYVHSDCASCCVECTVCVVTTVTPTGSCHSSAAGAANTETQALFSNVSPPSPPSLSSQWAAGDRAAAAAPRYARSHRLSVYSSWAPSCRRLSCPASVDVITGPVSAPVIGRPAVTRPLFAHVTVVSGLMSRLVPPQPLPSVPLLTAGTGERERKEGGEQPFADWLTAS